MKFEFKSYGEVCEYDWENGVKVCLWLEQGLWDYIADEDPETYLSGMFMVEPCTVLDYEVGMQGTVIDYDGVFELPVEVRKALGFHYRLDI